MNSYSIEELAQSLYETVEWCQGKPKPWNPLSTFRSLDISPEFGATTHKEWVDSVVFARRYRLTGAYQKLEKHISPESLSTRGRILVFFPDEHMDHGIEEVETQGYFTSGNVPPWDTWVAYMDNGVENYLVCWVPADMIEVVKLGIEVCPEECFNWLGARAKELKHSLELQGVI